MKVIYTLFNQASGKIAGVVATKNRGGNCIRARVIPSNPRDTQQSRIRAILSSIASAWRSTLTTEQRDDWNLLGNETQTGENRFIAANTVKMQGGGTMVSAAPASAAGVFTPFTPGTTVADAAGEFSIEDDGTVTWFPANATDSYNLATGGVINFYVSKPQSPSRYAQQFPFSWTKGVVRGGSALTGAQTFTYPYSLSAGDIVYVRVSSVGADGKLAPDQEFRYEVIAS